MISNRRHKEVDPSMVLKYREKYVVCWSIRLTKRVGGESVFPTLKTF